MYNPISSLELPTFQMCKWSIITFVVSIAIVMVFGCACNVIGQEEQPARAIAEKYFEEIQAKDFDTAALLYSSAFLATSSKEQAINNLQAWNSRLGDIQSYKFEDWLVRDQVGIDRVGTIWVLRYKVLYKRGQTEEILTLFRPIGSNEIKIKGHQINPF